MTELLGLVGVAVVVFVTTNIDDVLLLAAFFSDRHLSTRSVVLGQFLGIGALVLASAAAAYAALTVPDGATGLLGAVPLFLGLRGLRQIGRSDGRDGDEEIRAEEARAERRTRSQVLAVAGVTVANGGDNLGVYIPLFARDPGLVPLYGVVFAFLTALWCVVGFHLVENRFIRRQIERYGHVALPVVLIALGLWILWDARVLLR
jgi:cadmium resistance protein CadD (predicted permease)